MRLDTPAPQAQSHEKLLLTVEEAAHLLSLGRSTVYTLLQRGEIPSISIGKSRRIPVDGLRQWIRVQPGGYVSSGISGGHG